MGAQPPPGQGQQAVRVRQGVLRLPGATHTHRIVVTLARGASRKPHYLAPVFLPALPPCRTHPCSPHPLPSARQVRTICVAKGKPHPPVVTPLLPPPGQLPPLLGPAIRVALSAASAVEAPGAASCAPCAFAGAGPSSGLHPRAANPTTGGAAALETALRRGGSPGGHQADPAHGLASRGQPAGAGPSGGRPTGCVCSVSF